MKVIYSTQDVLKFGSETEKFVHFVWQQSTQTSRQTAMEEEQLIWLKTLEGMLQEEVIKSN